MLLNNQQIALCNQQFAFEMQSRLVERLPNTQNVGGGLGMTAPIDEFVPVEGDEEILMRTPEPRDRPRGQETTNTNANALSSGEYEA
mmetsp:Transcript_16096/g.38102  ORF Transcript_16096/g.38102 Transcript_16096/m.38102 type:complete len:87 (+) Transcript_16096:84-344(+)